MKKNLLTFLFVLVFVCGGAFVVNAKSPSSPENSTRASKNLSPAKIISNKIKALAAKCDPQVACEWELQNLIVNNAVYEAACAQGGYQLGCAPVAELLLLQSAAEYENCLYWNSMFNKNIDKIKARNKKQGANG